MRGGSNHCSIFGPTGMKGGIERGECKVREGEEGKERTSLREIELKLHQYPTS